MTAYQVQRPLTEREQVQFRKDFQDKEKEIQKYTNVYLSALVIVAGWIIGPESRGALTLFLGNNGYNMCAWYLVVVVNMVFTCFLIYKSILIQEIMQFITYLSPRECGLQYWEAWRRSTQSASKPVRKLYFFVISSVPILTSIVIMLFLGFILIRSPDEVRSWVAPAPVRAAPKATRRNPIAGHEGSSNVQQESLPLPDADRFREAFLISRVLWVVVALLHIIPSKFVRENSSMGRQLMLRWNTLQHLHPESPTFEPLIAEPYPMPAVTTHTANRHASTERVGHRRSSDVPPEPTRFQSSNTVMWSLLFIIAGAVLGKTVHRVRPRTAISDRLHAPSKLDE